MDNPQDTSHLIQEQMARIRRELADDVEQVVDQAKELVNWRSFVKKRPWVMVGAAAAVGYLLVPQRPQVIRPDAEVLAQLAKRHALEMTPRSSTKTHAGILNPVVNYVGAFALRSLGAMVGQQLEKFWAAQAGASQAPPTAPEIDERDHAR